MKKLERPLIFFDIETTGLNVAECRIVQLAIVKCMPDGEILKKSRLINPECDIPQETTDIHGITNEMVKDQPPFKLLANSLCKFLSDSDLGGFNCNNFDIPVLCEEFARCDIEFPTPETKVIDVGNIFKKFEQRTLVAAMQFYCNQDLKDAHNAEADAVATQVVFNAQCEKYEELQDKDVNEIADFCKMDNRADYAGKIIEDENGDYLYAFGRSKGKKISEDLDFAEWMLDKDFTLNTKNILRKAITKYGHKIIN